MSSAYIRSTALRLTAAAENRHPIMQNRTAQQIAIEAAALKQPLSPIQKLQLKKAAKNTGHSTSQGTSKADNTQAASSKERKSGIPKPFKADRAVAMLQTQKIAPKKSGLGQNILPLNLDINQAESVILENALGSQRFGAKVFVQNLLDSALRSPRLLSPRGAEPSEQPVGRELSIPPGAELTHAKPASDLSEPKSSIETRTTLSPTKISLSGEAQEKSLSALDTIRKMKEKRSRGQLSQTELTNNSSASGAQEGHFSSNQASGTRDLEPNTSLTPGAQKRRGRKGPTAAVEGSNNVLKAAAAESAALEFLNVYKSETNIRENQNLPHSPIAEPDGLGSEQRLVPIPEGTEGEADRPVSPVIIETDVASGNASDRVPFLAVKKEDLPFERSSKSPRGAVSREPEISPRARKPLKSKTVAKKVGPLIELRDGIYFSALGPDELPGLVVWTLENMHEDGSVEWSFNMQRYFEPAPVSEQLQTLREQRATLRRTVSRGLIVLAQDCEALLRGTVFAQNDVQFKRAWNAVLRRFDEQVEIMQEKAQHMFDQVDVDGNCHALCRKLENLIKTYFVHMGNDAMHEHLESPSRVPSRNPHEGQGLGNDTDAFDDSAYNDALEDDPYAVYLQQEAQIRHLHRQTDPIGKKGNADNIGNNFSGSQDVPEVVAADRVLHESGFDPRDAADWNGNDDALEHRVSPVQHRPSDDAASFIYEDDEETQYSVTSALLPPQQLRSRAIKRSPVQVPPLALEQSAGQKSPRLGPRELAPNVESIADLADLVGDTLQRLDVLDSVNAGSARNRKEQARGGLDIRGAEVPSPRAAPRSRNTGSDDDDEESVMPVYPQRSPRAAPLIAIEPPLTAREVSEIDRYKARMAAVVEASTVPTLLVPPKLIAKLSDLYPHIGMMFPVAYSQLGPRNSDAIDARALIESMQQQSKLYEEWMEVMQDYATVFSHDDRAIGMDNDYGEGSNPSASVYNGGTKALHYRVKSSRPEVYDIVTDVFRESFKSTWEELPAGLGLGVSWNLLWTWSKPRINMTHLLVWQRVNHFHDSKQLTRKDLLKKNLQRFTDMSGRGAEAFEIMPQTFILPHEYTQLVKAFTAEENRREETDSQNFWIMKPVGMSRGRGITLVRDVGSLTYSTASVVQRYIERPLCLDGYKFDLRLYVLVTSFKPLEAFIYKEGFARVSTVRYSLHPSDMSNKFIHLTNAAIQKEADEVQADNPTQSHEETLGGSKIPLFGPHGLWKRLENNGLDIDLIWRNICVCVLKSLVVVDEKMSHQPCCFEVFGYDVILDEHLRPWLLEVNASPSMSRSNALDIRVKNAMIRDTIKIVDPPPYDRAAVARVIKRRLGDISKNRFTMNKNDPRLEDDLRDILGDQVPRQIGEDPKQLGDYQKLCPNTKLHQHVLRLKGKIINPIPR